MAWVGAQHGFWCGTWGGSHIVQALATKAQRYSVSDATRRDRYQNKRHVLLQSRVEGVHRAWPTRLGCPHVENLGCHSTFGKLSTALFPKQQNTAPKRESAPNLDLIGSFEGIERLLHEKSSL